MLIQVAMILCLIPDSREEDQNYALLAFYPFGKINSALYYSSMVNLFEPPLRNTLNPHRDISPEADPVAKSNPAPFIWLVDEIDDDVALVGLQH